MDQPTSQAKIKLISRKVAADLALVFHGGWVTDDVAEFANEWWNFRYGLKQAVGKMRLVGPATVRQLCSRGVPDALGQEFQRSGAVLMDVKSDYFTSEDKPNEAQW